MKEIIKQELSIIKGYLKSFDRDTLILFITIAVVQTISYYFTSRRFFRRNIFHQYFINQTEALNFEFVYWFTGDFLVFLIVPLLVILFLHKRKISEFGFAWGEVIPGMYYTLLLSGIMAIVLWFVSADKEFASKYPLLKTARHDTLVFWIFNFGFLIYMLAWEFIWRGYTLFGLEKRFGTAAVLIQMIPFVILHNGKPALETFSAIPGGIALGLLALRTRSFLYGVIIHFVVMFLINWFTVVRYKSGIYGVGFDDLYNFILSTF